MDNQQYLQGLAFELMGDKEWQLPENLRFFLMADLAWSLLAL